MITEDQAYDIYEDTIEKHDRGEIETSPKQYLNFTEYEWTAFCHGASLATLAKWRKNGWPDSCSKCGTPIDYKEYGWTIKDNQIKGLTCC
jgi:hypothetical protein